MKLVSAIDLDPAQLVAVEAIYRDAFRPGLRTPFEELLEELFLVAFTEDDRPAGLAVLRPLGPTGWVYMRYFAAASRGQGLGSATFTELARSLTAAGHTRLIWDVEDPDEREAEGQPIGEAETLIRQRRIVFYRRLGGQLLAVRGYHTPSDEEGPHRLRLMATELGSTDSEPSKQQPIMGEELRELILAVYRYRFGLKDDDPLVRRTLTESEL